VAVTQAIPADLERLQPPGPEAQWSDSFYFGGGDARTGTAFYTRIGRRPNEGRVEAAFGVWLPDGRFVLCFAREDDGEEIAAGGMSYECALPHELWRLEVETTGMAFARAEDLAVRGSGTPVEVRASLRFSAWTGPFEFASGLTERVAARHYEQAGSMSGVITVDGRRFGLAGGGMRDHSWGVRNWQGVPYWRWTGMLVDPDTFLLVNQVGTEDGGATVGGCLMLDGELAQIVEGSVEGEQASYVARATDAVGREATLRGEGISIAPLRQRRDGRLTLVNEALTRLRWDEREGIGISEWLTQTADDSGAAA
jgi:hypothetical protein